MIVLLLILLAIIGLPLFVVLSAGGMYASLNNDLDPVILIIEMYRLSNYPNLIAIPLFTLAGITMASGGAPNRLISLFNALFGWMPGGMAIVCIFSCAFFTALTGASGVTIIALGGLLFPLLIHTKYTNKFTTGLLTSSGSLGLLFPPSMAILLYGIVSGVSIDELFLAGLIPGLILLILLSLYSFISANSYPAPDQSFSFYNLKIALYGSIWDILLPVIIIFGIFSGFLTITEAATFTAIYALFIETVIYREISLTNDLNSIFIETGALTGSILIILAAAMGLTNLIVDSQLPSTILEYISQFISDPIYFLFALNIFLLIVGATMDIFSAIIVVAPLIIPLARQYNIDPVHLGIIFLANLEIGYLTPPVGINLFIASQKFTKPILSIFKSTIPFLSIMLIWLIIISYIPSLSLWWRP
ncbi:MAG: TRAP transporter large permease [Gammaproteobacteria bacterium]|nr:TRAP transporter large permease [Gammaproteobacteria bacterium]